MSIGFELKYGYSNKLSLKFLVNRMLHAQNVPKLVIKSGSKHVFEINKHSVL